MPFDWEQFGPYQEVNEVQASLAREIAETFLTKGTGTPDHQKRVQLRKDRNLLNRLTQLGLIRNNRNQYYPAFPALYYVSAGLRESYTEMLHLILSAIKALYESSGPRRFSSQQIEEQVKLLLSSETWAKLAPTLKGDIYPHRAMLFLQDLARLVSIQESNNPDTPVGELFATDNILDYESLELAWSEELAGRPRPQLTRIPSASPGEPKGASGFDVGGLKADLNDVTVKPRSLAPKGEGEAAANGAAIRPPSQRPVYISYAPQDLAWMTRVAMYLAEAGFYVPDPPHSDSSVRSEIAAEQLRRQSRVFILLVSFHYLESEEIHKTEFPDIRSLVQGDARRIIYVILEQCPWSSRLALGLPATVIPVAGSALSEKSEEQVKDELHTLARAVRSAIQDTDKAAGEHELEAVPPPQTKLQAEEETNESIEISSISDAATAKDTLGFKPYVEAISRFLLSGDTKPPLTLSIEGEWGSGKTSFMLQLKNAVTGEKLWTRLKRSWAEANGNAPEAPSRNVPKRRRRLWQGLKKKRRFSVQFNPWRHDKEDSLWAAFALEFLRQASRQRFLFRRWWGHARLFWAHYHWRSGWFEMLRAMVVWLALGVLVIGSIEIIRYKPRWAEEMLVALSKRLNSPEIETSRPENGELPSATEGEKKEAGEKGTANFDPILRMLLLIGGNAAYFAVVLTIWLKVKDVVGNPLEINLKKYLRSPDYVGRVAFVEQFHADFRKIVDAYAGKEKVFVFIDDLDRCEVPKAAELMKAVNLMIADDPRLIFILGMDREKVAAGLAVKYERILPYLSPEGSGTAEDLQWKRRWGLGFGQDFLQKFIQLPFRVPEPNPEKYDDFIKTISAPPKSSAPASRDAAPKASESRSVRRSSGTNLPAQINAPAEIPTAPAPTPAEVQARRERELQFQGDSDKVRAVALMVAETLGRNPRRLKQFVNLFRLQAYIVNEIGLFDQGHGGTPPVTLEQLGKFVAIGLRWPGLLADFAEDPTLLGSLEQFVDKGDPHARTATHNRWLGESRMQKFLNYGIEKQKEKYTLSNPSLYQLLHICPQRIRPQGPRTP